MRFGNGNTEALEARVAQLEAAVFALVSLELDSQCPQSIRAGTRGFGKNGPLPALQPFVTVHDPMGTGRVVRPGVGAS